MFPDIPSLLNFYKLHYLGKPTGHYIIENHFVIMQYQMVILKNFL